MQDFAGCRLIFDNIDDLNNFRDHFHEDTVNHKFNHKLKHSKEKFDYIKNPKSTGYRSIHDVFIHRPLPNKGKGTANKPWHGLLVEIQYRTRIQNAWATAVEISDLIGDERTKFTFDKTPRVEFFSVASEIIARKHEGLKHAYLDKTTDELRSMLNELEKTTKILENLNLLSVFEIDPKKFGEHTVLNLVKTYDSSKPSQLDFFKPTPIKLDLFDSVELKVTSYRTGGKAIKAANEAEASEDSLNAVYVHSNNPAHLKTAYLNYFNDSTDFVGLLER